MKASWLDDEGGAIEVEALREQGVLYQGLSTEPDAYQPVLDELRESRGYVEQDVVALGPDTPDLDTICAKFVDEHYHDEDEVRFVLAGAGVFDIRSRDDRWMRVAVETGDLIVVPARRYHRFFLGDDRTIRCVRLFKDAGGWVPHYRDR